jgi:predicted DNA-binding transcriptional regulator YafY
MATNKLALLRYKTIDDCLKNRFRKWTLEDLIEKVSDALYEFEGISTGVSRRTIQADIQVMRSDRLGYNAPIVVADRKFYAYEDTNYSITKSPINNADVEKMREIVSVLKQLNGFNYFDEMSDLITKLENNVNKSTHKSRNYIQFEDNKQLKGIEHINSLYQAILSKTPLLIEYRSFKAHSASKEIYYPYLLKEYRNRWFLITKPKKGNLLVTMALDRIIEFHQLTKELYVEYEGIDFDRYFSDLLGVTKSHKDRGCKVVLHFDSYNAPYVLTKPLHHSQQLLKQDHTGITIRIDVVLNFELEKEILGFGECVKVLAPRNLKNRIKDRLLKAGKYYSETSEDVNPKKAIETE